MRSPSTELTCKYAMKPTDLWQFLRNRKRCNKKFRRQHTIGNYVADFYCAEENLIVEIDGCDHFTDEGRLHVHARDRFMHTHGLWILRFPGKQVELETEWVLIQIDPLVLSYNLPAVCMVSRHPGNTCVPSFLELSCPEPSLTILPKSTPQKTYNYPIRE